MVRSWVGKACSFKDGSAGVIRKVAVTPPWHPLGQFLCFDIETSCGMLFLTENELRLNLA